MPGPTVTFGFMIATLLGSGFHFIAGGDSRRLAVFLLAGWLGFLVGHFAGGSFNIAIFDVGSLRLLPAASGAILALVFARAVTSIH